MDLAHRQAALHALITRFYPALARLPQEAIAEMVATLAPLPPVEWSVLWRLERACQRKKKWLFGFYRVITACFPVL